MGEFLNTNEAAEMLRIKIRTLYKMTAERVIPFYKPGGKVILFKRADIQSYLENGRIQTVGEVKDELFKFLKKTD